ncbi:hypothetical protein GCM10027299_45670 [Larkinella ripae]
MSILRPFFLFASMALGAVSCLSPFQPETQSIEPSLVVEGMITDQPGPYSVKLTQTSDYSFAGLNLITSGATVTLTDNLGNQEVLQETPNTGVYQTRKDGMQGVAGRSYKISIQTKTGKQYESELELLKTAVPIQRVYYRFREDPFALTSEDRSGWDVYVDLKDSETAGDYYRWTWTHYEQIQVCNTYRQSQFSDIFYDQQCCSPCWDIVRCYDCLNVRSDAAINGKVLSGQLITRVPYTSNLRYYLEVEQQTISAGAFRFFESVRKLVSNTGGLFDAAPATVRGNLRCVSAPNEPVFGYFGAVGIAVSALYVDRLDGIGTPTLTGPPNYKLVPPDPCYPCETSLYRTTQKPGWW